MENRDNLYELQQVVEREELKGLASRMKDDLPYSATMYNILLISSRGYNVGFKYEFFIPKNYPNSHIVIWKKYSESRGTCMFCKEEETHLLLKIIQDAEYLSYLKEYPLNVHSLPDYLIDSVHDALRGELDGPMENFSHSTFTYMPKQSYLLRCPAGMKAHRLSKAGVLHMLHTNKYCQTDSDEDVCTLASNTPAVGIYLDPTVNEETIIDLCKLDYADEDKIPISWIGTYHFGPIGMLMTDQVYRGRGLGLIVTEMIGRLQLSEGFIPHAHVKPDNPSSASMFRKLSNWTDTHRTSWLCRV